MSGIVQDGHHIRVWRRGLLSVQVLSYCVTNYDLIKVPKMLAYYENKGCGVKTLAEYQ